jgi:uncharacterized protein YcfJ
MRQRRGNLRGLIAGVSTLAVLTVTGCSEPLTTREKGALLGGGLGAGTGALIGGGKGAAIGGAAGALGGAIVGDQMQRRENDPYYYEQRQLEEQREYERQRREEERRRRERDYDY